MRKEAEGRARVSLVRVLALSILLLVPIAWTMRHANFVLGRALLFAFPGWETTYRSARPLPSGGVIARGVRLVPPDGDEDGTFVFDRVRLDVPFFEYYRSGFSRERGALLNAIRHLHLEFSGGHGDLAYPFTRELALFGDVSAAPFEAEGCASDSLWIERELADMGLHAGGTQLVLDYALDRDRLVKRQVLDTPGVGRVEFRREMVKHDTFSLFSLVETGRSEVARDEWHVSDAGFVAARNRHCAAKDRVGVDEFVQRHVASAKRLLESVGLAAAPGLEQAYREYAGRGGKFAISVRYDPPIGAPLYGAEDMSSWLPRMNGTAAHDGRSVALAFAATPVRPLPEGDAATTTYELIRREGARATIDATAASATGAPPSAATAQATATERPPVATAAAANPAAQPVAATPAAAPLQLSYRQVAAVPAAAGTPSLIGYADLRGYVGKRLTVFQHGRGPERVEILRVVDGGNVLVRRALAGGSYEYVLDRKRFDHAEP